MVVRLPVQIQSGIFRIGVNDAVKIGYTFVKDLEKLLCAGIVIFFCKIRPEIVVYEHADLTGGYFGFQPCSQYIGAVIIVDRHQYEEAVLLFGGTDAPAVEQGIRVIFDLRGAGILQRHEHDLGTAAIEQSIVIEYDGRCRIIAEHARAIIYVEKIVGLYCGQGGGRRDDEHHQRQHPCKSPFHRLSPFRLLLPEKGQGVYTCQLGHDGGREPAEYRVEGIRLIVIAVAGHGERAGSEFLIL